MPSPRQVPSPGPPVGLYVHVPFCLSVCPYCDFVVHAGAAARGPASLIVPFIGALRAEIDLRADALDERFGQPGAVGRPRLESIYIGGGTPSLVGAAELAALIELVGRRFGLAPGAEITLEANPGRDDRGDPVAQAAAGVTRLSLGAQSFDEAELRALGRRHSPSDIVDAVAAARAAGIPSLNLDLLDDVPGQSLDSWTRTLDVALSLEPDHISIYALSLDDPDAEGLAGSSGDHQPVRRGARRWRERARRDQDEDRAAAMYELAVDRLARAGFRGYEISNWARPGQESRHNLGYWTRRPIEGVGPGAHGFDGRTRRWNAARLDGYLGALAPSNGGPSMLPPGGAEPIGLAAATAEQVILGLRLDTGLAAEYGERAPLASVIDWASRERLVAIGPDRRIRLTTRGRLLSNELFARLV